MNEGKRLARSAPNAGAVAVRSAAVDDAAAISALIRGLAGSFVAAPDAPELERFLATVMPEAVAGYIASPRFVYLVATTDDRLVGVSAIRDNSHLYHLFVALRHQGRGIGTRLWQTARDSVSGEHDFTVNATVGSVPIYERFGFRAEAPRIERDGIAFVPMRRPAGTQESTP